MKPSVMNFEARAKNRNLRGWEAKATSNPQPVPIRPETTYHYSAMSRKQPIRPSVLPATMPPDIRRVSLDPYARVKQHYRKSLSMSDEVKRLDGDRGDVVVRGSAGKPGYRIKHWQQDASKNTNRPTRVLVNESDKHRMSSNAANALKRGESGFPWFQDQKCRNMTEEIPEEESLPKSLQIPQSLESLESKFPYRYSSAGPSESNPTMKEVSIRRCLDRAKSQGLVEFPDSAANDGLRKFDWRRVREAPGFESTQLKESTAPLKWQLSVTQDRMPPGMVSRLKVPYAAESEFDQYVLSQLHPNWHKDNSYNKKVLYHMKSMEDQEQKEWNSNWWRKTKEPVKQSTRQILTMAVSRSWEDTKGCKEGKIDYVRCAQTNRRPYNREKIGASRTLLRQLSSTTKHSRSVSEFSQYDDYVLHHT